MPRVCLPLGIAALAIAAVWSFWPQPPAGVVSDEKGPLSGAVVRVQGQSFSAVTDSQGRFHLPPAGRGDQRVTAWKERYSIGSASPGTDLSQLRLSPLPAVDHDNYVWIDPTPSSQNPSQCGNCHAEIHREWAGSAHARSGTNPRVLKAFAQLAQDRPDDTGVCAKCHAPTLRDPDLEYDLRTLAGVDKHGVHCDYCHKVTDAPPGKFGTRFGNDGFDLLRPPSGQMLFFGPLDDAVRPGELFGYAPVYKDSRYCASCHEGVIYGVHVYGTYSEWLASPARRQGKQCQSCHMAPTGKMTNIAPLKGGIERSANTLASHAMPGANLQMLQQCLSITADINGSILEVRVTADKVGHRVPTGFPDHQLLLVVFPILKEASRMSALLPQTEVAIRTFAKRLAHPKRGMAPFWLADENLTQDTRLFPGETRLERFDFPPDWQGARIQLIYRREIQAPPAQPERSSGGQLVIFDRQIMR